MVYGQKQALEAWSSSTWSALGHKMWRFFLFSDLIREKHIAFLSEHNLSVYMSVFFSIFTYNLWSSYSPVVTSLRAGFPQSTMSGE